MAYADVPHNLRPRVIWKARALLQKGRLRLGSGAPIDALQALEQSICLVQGGGVLEVELPAREWVIQALLVSGWPEEASMQVSEAVELAVAHHPSAQRLSSLARVTHLALDNAPTCTQLRIAREDYGAGALSVAIERLDRLRNRMSVELRALTARVEMMRTRIWGLLGEAREARAAAARAVKWAQEVEEPGMIELARDIRAWAKAPDIVRVLAQVAFTVSRGQLATAIRCMERQLEKPWPKDAPITEVDFHIGRLAAYCAAGRGAEVQGMADTVARWAVSRGTPDRVHRIEAIFRGDRPMNHIYHGWTP